MIHHRYIEEALFRIRMAALEYLPTNPEENGTSTIGKDIAGEYGTALKRQDSSGNFQEIVGAMCDEWRACVYQALFHDRPMAWTAQERIIEDERCLVKHSLSPLGREKVFGIIQYFPLILREKLRGEALTLYGALPVGVYALERGFTLCCGIVAMKRLLYLPFMRNCTQVPS